MERYLKDMKVGEIRRPYEGSQGVEFECQHPRGLIWVIYHGLPFPPDTWVQVPYQGLPIWATRDGEFYAYCLKDAEFSLPMLALQAALILVQEHIEKHGVPEPVDWNQHADDGLAKRLRQSVVG